METIGQTEVADRPLILSERWHLATLRREDLQQLIFASLVVAGLYVLFQFLGNTVMDVNSRSAFRWMVSRWGDRVSYGADYSHGYLIPFVSLFIIWYRRRELWAAPKKVSYAGLGVVVLALFLHWVGAKMQQTRFSLMGLVLLIWGTPFYLLGWSVAKILIFPCAYLIFCIPLTFLDALTFPLKMLATSMATVLLNGLGLAAQSVGSRIYLTENPEISFEIAAACSGLSSLLAMTALTSVYAYFTQKTLARKWTLFFSSIPLAVIGNVVRVTTVFLVAQAFGERVAGGIYHDYSGYIVFSVAILLMLAIGTALNMNHGEWRGKLRRLWLQPARADGGRP